MTFRAPKKRFSQNFLRDPKVIQEIINIADIREQDCLIEIGPGYGALTSYILKKNSHLTVVEIDQDAVRHLKKIFSGETLQIMQLDFLDFGLGSFDVAVRLIGNLPYHISSAILFHVDEHRQYVKDATFMLQKEVVDRLISEPGGKSYGKLSIMMQLNWNIEKLFDIPPEAFDPTPKVWSSMLHLKPKKNPDFVEPRIFKKIVFYAFSKRRKTLRNALKGVVLDEEFKLAEIDSGLRPEQLSVNDYVRLTNIVSA